MRVDPFFLRSPLLIAPELIGSVVSHAGVSLRIVETEAYLGADDEASHARSGPTARCLSMYGPVGRAYIYRSYGIHLCFNIVCHGPESGGAILVRAGEVTAGLELARQRRGRSKGLADGPGKFAQCLALTPQLDGTGLDGPIVLERATSLEKRFINCGPRVGITRNARAPYRFWLKGSPEVSRAPRAAES